MGGEKQRVRPHHDEQAAARMVTGRGVPRDVQGDKAPMDAPVPLTPVSRLRLALEVFESGVDLMRQNLRRERPAASDTEIEAALVQWLRTRPGAEHGDAPGRPRPVPEVGG